MQLQRRPHAALTQPSRRPRGPRPAARSSHAALKPAEHAVMPPAHCSHTAATQEQCHPHAALTLPLRRPRPADSALNAALTPLSSRLNTSLLHSALHTALTQRHRTQP